MTEESVACEIPAHENDHALIEKIIREYKTIAVVGISKKEERPSYMVAKYLQENSYKVVPVNPTADEILGEKCYKSVEDIGFDIDVVDVFRKPSALPELAETIASLPKKPKAVWFQIGVINSDAVKTLEDAGIEVVQNLCMKIEHARVVGG